MTDIQENAKEFLVEILKDFRFDLNVSSEKIDEGYYFDLTGEDIPFLLNESAELLDALEVLLFQIFGKDIDRTERFICDADGFRQTRKAELQAMARFAAQNVRKSGNSFTFGKLNSTERRIIHLTLQSETDLTTESIGEGRDRRLRVQLK
ncbi:MAG TPA: R3H domain-containing nucleic acid-binding protein [Pyrinomonadaceae bacterium]|jgi:spoIIIJ-associated protein